MNGSIRPQDLYRPAPSSFDALDRSAAAAGWAGAAGLPQSWSERADAAHVEHLVDALHASFARDPSGAADAVRLAFGDKADLAAINALLDAAVAGRLAVPPVRIVEPGALGSGALGAYSATGGPGGGPLILLDRSVLADDATALQVFTEEYGHHLDTALGGADAAGDEGAIFAHRLLSGPLDTASLDALRSENDHGRIELGGVSLAVEFWGVGHPGGGVAPATDDEIAGGGGSGGSGDDDGGGEGVTSGGGRDNQVGHPSGGQAAATSEDDDADEDEDDEDTVGTTDGGSGEGLGPVTAAPPAVDDDGFDTTLDGTLDEVPETREEYVTTDGGGQGPDAGAPVQDDPDEGGEPPRVAGTGNTAEEDAAGGDEDSGDAGGGSTIPGLGSVPTPMAGISILPPGLVDSLDPFAGGGLAEMPPLGPVTEPPVQDPADEIDGDPFDEIPGLGPEPGPAVQVPMAPPAEPDGGEPPVEAGVAVPVGPVVPGPVSLGPVPPIVAPSARARFTAWASRLAGANPGVVAVGTLYPSATGGPREMIPIAGTGASVESYSSDLDGEVHVDGEPTGIRVDEVREERDGVSVGTGVFTVRTEADAWALEAAGVPVGADGTLGGTGAAPTVPEASPGGSTVTENPRPGAPAPAPVGTPGYNAPAPDGAWDDPGGPATGGEQMGPVNPTAATSPDAPPAPEANGTDQGGEYYEPGESDDEPVVLTEQTSTRPGQPSPAEPSEPAAEPMSFETGDPTPTGTPPSEAAANGPTTTVSPVPPPAPTTMPGPAPVAVQTDASPQEAQPSGAAPMVNPADSRPPDDQVMDARTARGPQLDPESQAKYDEVFGGRTQLEETTRSGTTILVIPDGDSDRAQEDFDRLGLSDVRERDSVTGPVRTGTLPDGNRITVRGSADGRPTMEVLTLDENGREVKGTKTEIRYGAKNDE